MSNVTFSNVDSLIADFAKAKKISRASLAEFVQSLAYSAVVKRENTGNLGRKTSDDSIRIREYIQTNAKELAGKKYTCKQLADMIGVDAATATNNIKWLAEHNKNIRKAGYAEKEAGKRGKTPALWEVLDIEKA